MNRFLISVFVVSLFAAAPLEIKASDGKRHSDEKLSYENLFKKSLLPTITAPPIDEIVECNGSGNLAQLNAWLSINGGATANAGTGTLTWSNTLNSVATGCGESLTATYEFFAIDDDGSVSAGTANFIIQDTNSPMVSMAGANMTVECDGTGNNGELSTWLAGNGGYTASDACSNTLNWTSALTNTVVSCGGAVTQTFQFTVADECGNSSLAGSSNFIIEDTTNPMISCPAGTTVECGMDTSSGTLGTASGTDLCSGIISTTFSDAIVVGGICPIVQTITRTWTVTDGCSNTNTCDQVIVIEDTTIPVITTIPQNMTVECDSTVILMGSSSKGVFMTNLESLNAWIANAGGAIASDACGGPVFWTSNQISGINNCGGTGEYGYEFFVADACGNQISAGTASFFVVDTQGPVITDLPRDTSIVCDGTGNAAQLMAWRTNNAGATASEGCSNPSVWTSDMVSMTPGCAGTFATTYRFTITDACGNATIAGNATFTVVDDTAPTWTTVPMNESVECDGAGNSTALNDWLSISSNLTNVTDACGSFTISTTLIDFSSGFCPGESVATYRFTATDECGNSASETAVFTIDDAVAPNISCPTGATVNCDGDTSPNTQGFATATDDCGLSGSPSYTDVSVAGTCPTIETITRTWSIMDDCGNTSTCNQMFIIQDASIPTLLVAPQDMTVECGSDNTAALIAWRDNNAGGLASDDCGSLTYSFVENSTPDPLLCSGTGCYNYTFSATDDCMNTLVLGTVEFCIEDNTAPQFSAEALSNTVECNGTGNMTELNAWIAANGGATATDSCDASLNWTATPLDTIENCGMTVVYQYEFAVADDCGNTSVTNADFTIVDTTIPIWINQPDIDDEECDGNGNSTGLANFLAAWTNLLNVSDNCGTVSITPNLISITTADNCPNLIEYKYEFVAMDQCGNTASSEAFFNTFDLTPPVINCPANSVISCDSLDTPASLGTATATDICSNTPTITYADVDVSTSACLVNRTRTWTAVDDCNNASTCNQTITIRDDKGPIVLTPPQDMTVECDGTEVLNPSGSKLAFATNTVEYANWIATAGGAVVSDACSNIATFSSNVFNINNTCGGSVAYTYEFFAIDSCSNVTSIGSATFTIEDSTPPSITAAPADTIVNCESPAAIAADLATWLGNNGGAMAVDSCSLGITWSASIVNTTSGCNGSTTTVYAFETEDFCGNTAFAGNASFIVNDTDAPVWDDALTPGDRLINCNGSGNAFNLGLWLGNWTDVTNAPDACGTTTITSDQTNIVLGACPNISVATYVFTASDECGNSDTRSATFTIQDTSDPMITCPANVTISCSDDASPNAQGFATGSDACSPTVAITYVDADVVTNSCLTTKTRTWTATDDCAQTMTCDQVITIEDTEDPVVITTPQNMTVECDGTEILFGSGSKGVFATNAVDLAAWLDAAGGAVVNDDCGNGVTFTSNLTNTVNGCGGTVAYTYEFFAEDACTNNVSIGSATFTIEDTQSPTVSTIPVDTVVTCAAAAVTAADLATWLGNNGGATASDPCSITLTWTATILSTTSTCPGDTTKLYQFEVEDACGNSTLAGNASFRINDNSAPVWNAGLVSGDSLVNCDGNGNAADLATWLSNWTDVTNAPDACGTTTITSNQTNIVTGACPNISVATYVFTASDECGNSDTRSATFTIEDTSDPMVSCPANVTISCSNDASPNAQGFATGSDACSPTVAITYVDADVVTNSCLTTKTRTWTATDDCAQTMTCDQVITIEDTEDPVVITAPQDMTVECDGTEVLYGSSSKGVFATNVVDLAAWLDTAGGAVVNDDCGNGVTFTSNLTNTVNGCGGTVAYTYEFFAEDACTNNVPIGSATFTIEDTQAPTVSTIPVDTVVTCAAAAVTAADLATWLGNNGGATASDPCSITLTWTATILSTTSTCPGDTTKLYQFEVEDACGNSTLAGNASFRINDNSAPVWIASASLPGNESVECDGNGNTGDLATWIADWQMATNATDACGTVTISSALSNLIGGTCPVVNVATYIFTASDECGNTSTQSATFTIRDTNVPTITCPGAATIACTADSSPNALGFAIGTDLCSTPGIPTYVDVSVAGTCPTLETITRTWTISDDCGNTNTCNQTITVQDNAVPVIVANPQDQTVECDGSGNLTERDAWLANNGFAIVTDDCGTVTFSSNLVTSPSGCSSTGCYTYAFAAQDGCGSNVSLGSADFCIEDTTSPMITAAATDLNVSCDGSATAAIDVWTSANGNAMATDGCGAIVWSFSILTANPTCTANAYTTTYQFTATDACGNVSSTTANLNITDTDAPTWLADVMLPGDETAECDGSGNLGEISTWLSDWVDPANVSDDCSAVTISTALTNFTPGVCPGNSVSTYEFTATDVCGNASTRTATFTISDTEMPTINCPANTTVECAADFSPGTLGFPSGSDDCGNLDSPTFADVAIAGTCPLVETVTRTWTISDECGNTSSCDQIISRQDTEDPTLILPPQTTFVECDGSDNTPELNVWLADVAGALASDDCGTVTYSNTVGATTTDCGSTGCTTYTFRATDLCGNVLILGMADFCIEDTTIPQITAAAQTEIVECDGSGNMMELMDYLTANGNAVATDFCDSDLAWSNSVLNTVNTCGGTSETTYQFTATDDCGNVAITSGKFIIQDATAPVWIAAISLPGDQSVECDGNGNTGDLSTWIGLWEVNTNAADDCGTLTITSQLFDFQGGTCPIVSVSTYQFTATDQCGNTSTRSATFTINDSTIPAITCPGGATIACTDDSSPNALGFATGTDVCSTPGIPTYIDVSVAGTCPTLETVTRTWTISDDCGNINTCNQTIVIEDNAVPVIVANPQNQTVECDGSGNTTEFNNWVANNGFAIVTDDCGTVTFNSTETATPSGCSGTGCYTYSFTAEDGCGNLLNLGNANFCIEDTNAPMITVAATDLNVSCNGSSTAAINAWTAANGNATATDACGSITWTFQILTVNPSCVSNAFSTIYQFTATDACGNASRTTANLNVTDNDAPTWLADAMLPGDETAECDGAGNAGDLTTWLADWTLASNVSDDCSAVTISTALTNFAPGTCPGNSVATYEFTATDVCGNASTRTATFTIEDTVMPTINCPIDATVECAADFSPGSLGFPSGSDDCGNLDSPTFSDVSVVGTCPLVATVTRIWTISDECGNTATCEQVIMRQDTEDPTLVLAPQTTFVECDGAGNSAELTVWLDDAGDALATDDCGTVTYSAIAGTSTNPCGSTGCTTYTFTATDLCGNTLDLGDADFCIEDTSIPQITAAAETEIVECDGLGNAADLTAYLTANANAAATDFCGSIIWSNSVLQTVNRCGSTSERTYQFTATDECGNVAVTTGKFIIEDSNGPTWDSPQSNLAVECDGNGNTTELDAWITLWENSTNASDDCGSVTITLQLFDFQGGTCPVVSVSTYQFTATDQCGNTSTRSATFTINDSAVPMITCPGAATIACTADNSPNALGFATATDVCGITGTPTYADVSVAGTCPTLETITRTWTIADECGNTNTCAQTIILEDNEVPVVVSLPQNQTVECDGAGNTTEFNAWLSNNAFSIVTDDCGSVTYTPTQTATPGDCSSTGCYTYTFTAEDGCGNSLNLGAADFCIQDTEAPMITTPASDFNVTCNGSATAAINLWTAANGNAVAADVCGNVTWSFTILTTNPSCVANAFSTIYQFTATDDCGNSASTTANLNLTDNSAPTWIVGTPGDLTVECDGSGNTTELGNWITSWTDAANVSDDCSTVTISSTLITFTPGTCPGNSQAVYEFAATDLCGNIATRTAVFEIEDTTIPMVTCPANATVNCSDDFTPGTLGFPSGSDVCGNLDAPTFSDATVTALPIDCPLLETITRTWTLSDECGNENTCDQIIIRRDTEDPVLIAAPQDLIVDCDGAGNATELVNWLTDAGDALASDDCSTINYSSSIATAMTDLCGSTGCTTYEFTATDGCGNALTLGQADFCIEDNSTPQITSLAVNEIVECGPTNGASLTDWLNANGNATATDACDTTLTWTNAILSTTAGCGNTSVTTYQFTATDDCGEFSVTTADFIIQDNAAPVWNTLATNEAVECDGTGNTAAFNLWFGTWTNASNVADVCGGGTVSINSNLIDNVDNCGGTSVRTYQFTAIDVCGNVNIQTATFTINDTTAPTIACPTSPITIDCSEDASPSTQGFATGTDVCGGATVTYSDVVVLSTVTLLDSITRTWVITDDCNNSNTCTQIIQRRDTENPTVAATPQNMTVECDGAGNTTDFSTWIDDHADALAADDCSTITYDTTLISTFANPTCAAFNCVRYEFTATDGFGNSVTLGMANFCIEDTTNPQVSTSATSLTLDCGDADFSTDSLNWVTANGNAIASDACDANLTWTAAILQTTANCGNTSTTTYQFTATDDCGNFSVTTADLIIQDVTAPVWSLNPGNSALECDGTGNTAAFNFWFGSWTNVANVMEGCGTATITSNLINNVDNCGGTSVRTFEFTATDECGNANVETATFTINDTTAPSISCPTSPITIDCSEDASPATRGFATGTDVCGGTTVTYSDVVVLSTVTLLDSITRTWVITDDCNNSNTCTQIIQRRDTENPTVAATPQNMTVECDGAGNATAFSTWIDDHADALAADDCSTITYDTTLISTFANPTCAAFNCVRYEFTATDGFGNSVTLGMANFCIEDTTNPQISTSATSLTLDCGDADFSTDSLNWVTANGNAIASDACDANLTWTTSILQTTNSCGNTSMTTYQFTATDDCGNFSVTTADLIIQDVIAPVWSLNPGNSALECDGTGNTAAFNFWFGSWTNVANVMEGCGTATITSNLINNVDNCGGTSVRTFEFTATDECGNANVETATFTINDTTAPSISCPTSPITIDCSEDASPATRGFATGMDVCGGTTVTYSDVVVLSTVTLLDSITRTWVITDDCNNDNTCTQIIQRRDTEDPTVAATPQNMTVECDGAGNATGFSTWIDDHADALAADDCSTITYDTTLISTFANPTCAAFNCVRYEFTATDGFGNSVTLGMANFCIEDTTNPQVSTLATSLTLDCGDADFSTDSLNWVTVNGNAIASDACDANLTWTAAILQTTANCGNTSTTTYQFTATDDCGNSSVTTADLIIRDVTAPVWALNPGNSDLECDGTGNTAAFNFWFGSWTNVANVMEGCGTATITSNLINNVDNCGGTSVRTFEFTATDECGNANVETATFTINDTTAPSISCPTSPITIDCSEDASPATRGFATGTDVCGGTTVTYSDVVVLSTVTLLDSITRTWVITDDCNNSNTCTQIIQRRDTEDPTVAATPQNMTVECDGAGNATGFSTWIDDHADALAADDCSTITYDTTLISTFANPTCAAFNCVRYEFTATDGFGNSVTLGMANFCIEDTTNPQVSTLATSLTLDCGDADFSTDSLNWVTTNGNAIASDACDGSLTWTTSILQTTNGCGNTSTTTYQFTATDDCGNFSVTTADLIIQDTIAPVWSLNPGNSALECDGTGNTAAFNFWFGSWTNVANVMEGCGTATITSNLINNVDNCGGTSVRTFEFTATDECGNANVETATFTINDTTAPTIACPTSPVTVDCNQDYSPTALGFAIGSDDCGNVGSPMFTDVIVAGSGTLLETITRTWSVSDDCGNISTCEQVIERRDTEDPTVVSTAQDLTIECDGNGNFGAFSTWINDHADAVASDDCSTITYDTTLISTTISCGSFNCVRYEFTAMDAVGNSVTLGQADFCIEDTTNPQISTSATSLTLDCGNPDFSADSLNWVNANGNAVAIDACDFNLAWTTSILQRNLTCGNTSTTTYQFRATDDCGNSSVTTADLIIEDNAAPVWIAMASLPGNDTVVCDGNGNTAELLLWVNAWTAVTNASDGCSNTAIGSNLLGFANSGCFGTSVSTYLFAASDLCGNISTQTATFTIIDTIAPAISCPSDVQITCTDDTSPFALGSATGMDACSNLPAISYSDIDVTNTCQIVKTRTWTATDNCGNSVTCDQIIQLDDTAAPTLTRMPTVANYEYFRDPTGACHSNVSNPQGINQGNGCWEIIFDLFDAQGNPMGLVEFDGPCAVDDCGTVITPVLSASKIIDNDCFSVWTASWRFEDNCGNFVDYDQTFTFVDQAAPLWTQSNPLLLSANCTDDIDAVIAANIPTIEDNCNGALVTEVNRFTVPGNCGSNFTQVVEYNAVDACGNLNPTRYQVRIDRYDTTAPTWIAAVSLPGNESVECDPVGASGSSTSTQLNDWLDAWKVTTNATDVCGAVTITEQLLNFFPGQCNGTGIWNYQFTAEDPCGNTSIQNATFTIEDTAGPIISTCPATVTVDCEDSIDPAVLGQPTATDVCNAVTGFTHSDASTFLGCPGPLEQITRTWTAIDACGNTSTCVQTINVTDGTVPTLLVTSNDQLILLNNANGACSIESTGAGDPGIHLSSVSANGPFCSQATFDAYDANGIYVESFIAPGPCAEDNCSSVSFGHSVTTAQNGCDFVTTITWAITDDCGNSITDVQVVTVRDMTPPAWVNQSTITVTANCGDDINALIAANAPTATDNCSVNYNVVSDNTIGGNCSSNYTRTITYSVSDDCGNTNPTNVDLVIILDDQTGPVFTVSPKDTMLECSANNATAIAIWLSDFADAQFMDVCGTATITAFPSDTIAACGATKNYEYSFVVADDCGNADTTTAMFMLIDTTAPVIVTAARDTTLSCDLIGGTALNNWLEMGGNAVATDNCANPVFWENELLSTTANSCLPDTLHYRLMAVDSCGGRDTTEAMFILIDTIAPIIVGVPNDTIIDCNGAIPPAASPTIDDCDANATMTFNETIVNLNTNGVLDSITRIWTATDCQGLISKDTQIIKVLPMNPPTLVFCPSNIGPIVSQNGQCVTVNWSAPIFSGGCPYNVTSTHNPGDCFPIGTTTVTYTATDGAGQTTTCSFDVTVSQFCQPTVNAANTFYIQKFVFNGVESTTGNNGGYIDLTTISSTVQQGQNVVLTLSPGGPGGVNTGFGYWRVWIDWNGDGDFYDPSELVIQLSGQGLIITQMTIPNGATLGEKRIRVAFHHFGFLDPCDPITDQNGEMEDYTLFVLPHLRTTSDDDIKTAKTEVNITQSVTDFGFAATPNANKVDLKWVANNGLETDRFIIERSKDGIQFNQLMTVENAAKNTNDLFYKTKDKNPLKGENFYRLKQILTNGEVISSEIQKVIFASTDINISFFPNPTSGVLNVEMPDFIGQSGRVTVMNSLSQSVMDFDLNSIEKLTQLDLNNLSDGVYFIRVEVGEVEVVEKVFLRR